MYVSIFTFYNFLQSFIKFFSLLYLVIFDFDLILEFAVVELPISELNDLQRP